MKGHDAFTALIPWYVNGTLDERDMAQLADHLASCHACAREVEATLADARAWHGRPHLEHEATLQGRDANFARLVRRLSPSQHHKHKVRWAAARPRNLAAVLVITLTVGSVWVWRASAPVDTPFEAMTAAPTPVRGTVMQVIFQPTTTEREVRELLLDAGGELVGSPSPSGVYRIALDDVSDPSAYAARLQRHPAVRWAEVERR